MPRRFVSLSIQNTNMDNHQHSRATNNYMPEKHQHQHMLFWNTGYGMFKQAHNEHLYVCSASITAFDGLSLVILFYQIIWIQIDKTLMNFRISLITVRCFCWKICIVYIVHTPKNRSLLQNVQCEIRVIGNVVKWM